MLGRGTIFCLEFPRLRNFAGYEFSQPAKFRSAKIRIRNNVHRLPPATLRLPATLCFMLL